MTTQTTGGTPQARSPKDTQELQRAQLATGRFARALQVLLRAARLYQKNHPHVMESLEAADTDLRAAFDKVCPLELRIERNRILFRGHALADPRGELKKLAEGLLHRGVTTLVFHPQTHLGELGTLAQLLGNTPLQPDEADVPPDWGAVLRQQHIAGIRINAPLEEKKADTVLTTLMAAVLAPDLPASFTGVGAKNGDAQAHAAEQKAAAGAEETEKLSTVEELASVLQLLARLAVPLRQEGKAAPQEVIAALRSAVAEAERRGVVVLAGAMTRHAPAAGEGLETYFSRLGEALAVEFASEQLRSGRIKPPELHWLFLRLAREVAAAGPEATGLRPPTNNGAKWTDESYAQRLEEKFWAEYPARGKADVLNSSDAWCVPVSTLRPYIEQLGVAGGARQARFILLNYARCLEAAESPVRLAAATGLSEVGDLIASLWSQQPPQELTRTVLRALLAETAPEVAGVLAAVVDGVARLALERAEYGELERILSTLEAGRAPVKDRGAATRPGGLHSLLPTLMQRMLENGRWERLVSASLEHRPLDASLPRILGRDPERLIDSLNAHLVGPRGLETLAPMARLLRAIGEPATGALVTRLFEPRTQRATAAVKLLAAARPERLLEALPRALPGWDWHLQDMAVGELVRMGMAGVARAFVEALPHAHALVVPMMIDEIGVAGETAALPLLLEIAAGQYEPMKDVFIRIKAVEALGRMRTPEAAELLCTILRQRNGLTHAEPAGLRAAAEEALALIENRPSSARLRTMQQAAERASLSFTRPRRYLRVPLESPLAARISAVESRGLGVPGREAVALADSPATAKVKTLSLGGAFVESNCRLDVGDSFNLEIRSGLKRIQGTAVVRNMVSGGTGVEFVHMKQEDREKLRQLVTRLLRD